ncbi:MAG: alkaline phosphatase family protein [Acidobacteriales bacterium]|nr:alkaline phosphatase family protein [Terriglobales bacterium]
MTHILRRRLLLPLLLLLITIQAVASANNGRPKLVVVIVVDQFRGDYLERYRDRFGPDGFRMLMDRGAWFTECYYDYANLHTAPGHATLGTGAYTNGHGILGNDWYDPQRKGVYSSVKDDDVRDVANTRTTSSASPRNLLASTYGDEVKLATAGRSRVYGVAFKDRSAILPSGHSADAAFWIDKDTGAWITSTYYLPEGKLPPWAQKFNEDKRAEKYWGLKFTDEKGEVFRTTDRGQKDLDGSNLDFYDTVGRTPFANEYTFEFVRELITSEQLGQHDTTDVLTISLSGYDILGHKVGPDSPQLVAETLALDRQLSEFFGFLGRQIGLANVWVALTSDHGIPPQPEMGQSLRVPSQRFNITQLRKMMNAEFSKRYPKATDKEFIKTIKWPQVFLSPDAFQAAGVAEGEAERASGEMVVAMYSDSLKAAKARQTPQTMMRGFYSRTMLEAGPPNVAADDMARKFAHSYSPHGGWYVMMLPPPFLVTFSEDRWRNDDDHGLVYSYDAHVPLLFYGLPFQPGLYRTHSEPVDLAVTLTSLLGINKPTHAVGRVLTEALRKDVPQTGESSK